MVDLVTITKLEEIAVAEIHKRNGRYASSNYKRISYFSYDIYIISEKKTLKKSIENIVSI